MTAQNITTLAKFTEFLVEEANTHLTKEIKIDDDRSFMPSGHNGPYYDIETPVRNTAHWLCTYSILFKKTNDIKFYDIANRLANFLVNPGPHQKNNVYIQRQKSGKDWCNGVIGQAWVIEALNLASYSLDRSELKIAAVKAAKAFTFNTKVAAWEKIDPANAKRAIDYTLNHQTWLAAAIIELNDQELNKHVVNYLDGLEEGAMRLRNDGVIAHLLYKNSLKGVLLQLRYMFSEKRNWNKVREKEVGYHLFNLHPLARIYKIIPDHSFFKSKVMKEAVSTAFDKLFFNELTLSSYAYPYNSPSFEYPLISKVFTHLIESDMENETLEQLYFEIFNFYKNVPDVNTLKARSYEFFIE